MGLYDSYRTGGDTLEDINYPGAGETARYKGQSFTAGSTKTLVGFGLKLQRDSDMTSQVRVDLFANTGSGAPSSLAHSILDFGSIPLVENWLRASFSNPYQVQNGSSYVLAVSKLTNVGVLSAYMNFSGAYANGSLRQIYNDGSWVWSSSAAVDSMFELYDDQGFAYLFPINYLATKDLSIKLALSALRETHPLLVLK